MLATLLAPACATTNSARLATNQIKPSFTAKVDARPGAASTYVGAILGQPGSMSNVLLAPGDALSFKTEAEDPIPFNYDSVLQVYSVTFDKSDRTSITISLARTAGVSALNSTVKLPSAIALTAPAPNAEVSYKGGSGALALNWSNAIGGAQVRLFAFPCGSAAVSTKRIEAADSGSFTISARDLAMSAPQGKSCVTIRIEREVKGTIDSAFAPESTFTALRQDYVDVNVVP